MGNIIEERSFAFAVRIVKLSRYLSEKKREYVISKQILRSGTSIGANVTEAQNAQSRADFISKMHIAFKETSETKYWLRLLAASGILTENDLSSLISQCTEIEKMLCAIITTTKGN